METLRSLGFEGPIELVNRGWGQSRLIAHLHDSYGRKNPVDGGPALMLMMDWDRTGGRIQRRLMDSMTSLDTKPCDELRRALSKAMKPDTMCVEDLPSFLGEHYP